MIGLEFKEFIAVTASVSTILQFLAGILVCRKYIRNGTTGEASGLAFVTCFTSCSLALRYGMLIGDQTIIVVNIFGISLQLLYVLVFMSYSMKKSLTLKQLSAAVIFVISVYLYSQYEIDEVQARRIVGFLSSGLAIAFFASPLSMLAHVMRVKSAETLPFPIILSSLIVSFQWLLYGYLLNDGFIVIPNFLGCVLSLFQLSLFILYPGRYPDQIHLTQL
ncbi:sugar transporter SWEET1 [Neodiprion pinetum]|uniref:Sugar transporter SWEET1 n=1 Tax=Neodiprion lecontei TaxID=441921 RepID=A0A6J0B8M6_NEOLC|nr:sugar transporter SWEET1 [Neodiprion lecontei]XP_046468642.1 sugar transporter SWEET1 [Neodiprion pinetum]XP_046608031.1 sugar transporter SWEET1 [Neodiprion virginianus]